MEPRPFLCLTIASAGRTLGVHKKLGGHRARTAVFKWPKVYSILYGVRLRIPGMGRRRKGRHSELCHLSSQVTVMCDGAWGWLNSCLSQGNSELIPCFALPIQLSLSQPMSSLYPFDSLPHPTRRGWASSCLVLSCQHGMKHKIVFVAFRQIETSGRYFSFITFSGKLRQASRKSQWIHNF